LRVGFFPNRIPFAFLNREGNLVGLDIERAHLLARELGVRAQFIQLQTRDLSSAMATGRCDIIMTGVMATPRREMETLFSRSYMDETLALLVRDHRRQEFASWASARQLGNIRVATVNLPHYVGLVRELLPAATLVPVDPDQLKLDQQASWDALVMPAERGAVQTLLRPEFSIVVPEPETIKMPLAYPLARRDREWAEVVNRWIEMKQKDGTSEALYKHWILGESAKKRTKSWSVMKDMLHWGS